MSASRCVAGGACTCAANESTAAVARPPSARRWNESASRVAAAVRLSDELARGRTARRRISVRSR